MRPLTFMGAALFAAVAGLLLVALQFPQARAQVTADKPSVHVFLQLDAKSSAVEKTLRERLPQLSITVFGRFRDFEDALTKGKPDALLTMAPVLEQQAKTAVMTGQREGKSTEAYVLASVDQPLAGRLSGKTIGVFDLLGRDGTQSLLTKLLNESDLKLRRVAKIEDLLPLLEFSAADGILLPVAMLKRLTERTRLTIKSRDVPGALGLPVVAILNPAVRDVIVQSFQKLDGATKSLLGIESWSLR